MTSAITVDLYDIKTHRGKIIQLFLHPIIIKSETDLVLFPIIHRLGRFPGTGRIPILNFQDQIAVSVPSNQINLTKPTSKILL